jgi:hypothetical protein
MVTKSQKRSAEKKQQQAETEISAERISLGASLTKKPTRQGFSFWIVGDTPVICHAWSEKAKLEMLSKQTGAIVEQRDRNPEEDFVNSLYNMGEGKYGFPVTAVKKAIKAVAHKDRGIAKTDVTASLHLDAEIVSVRPALAGAKCNMPLVRIYGSDPIMREDMVRVGVGMTKTASLAYRAEFTVWAIRITGSLKVSRMATHALSLLVNDAGIDCGIGDWRNEKDGWAGSFHLAGRDEEEQWEAFRAGRGPLPVAKHLKLAAE